MTSTTNDADMLMRCLEMLAVEMEELGKAILNRVERIETRIKELEAKKANENQSNFQ